VKKRSPISTRNKRRAGAVGRVATATVLFGFGVAFSSVDRAAADFSGVWVVRKYSPELKTSDGSTPPLLPAAAQLYDQRKALLAKGDKSFDAVASHCGAPGMPRVMMIPYDFEIVQSPRHVVFLFEWNRMYRRVDVDGPNLNADDLQWTGRAVAHWEGDTLVIRTTQIDATLMDGAGMPHSDALAVTERLQLLNSKTLQDRIRFEDPKTFRTPWETTVTYRKLPKGTQVGEYICLDHLQNTPAIVDNNYLNYPK
jgi:hypothetical protein